MTYNRVNPPTHLELPPEIKNNKQLKKAFDDRDYIAFQQWKRSGGGRDFIDELEAELSGVNANLKSKLFEVRKLIGSGKPVTIDTTGFTIDTTEQTIDMTEV